MFTECYFTTVNFVNLRKRVAVIKPIFPVFAVYMYFIVEYNYHRLCSVPMF